MTTTASGGGVESLVKKWREAADSERDYYSDALRACANELESALSRGEPVAWNCAKATPSGGACESWCGNRETCVSTETAVAEVIKETGALKDMRLLRFYGECPPVGTKLYAHPNAARGVDEARVESDYRHFLCYANLEHHPMLRYAYFHGADVGLDKPEPPDPKGGLPISAPAPPAIEACKRTILDYIHPHRDEMGVIDAAFKRLATALETPNA